VSVKTDLTIRFHAKEEEDNDLGDSRLVQLLELTKFYPSGTGASQFDVVYGDSGSAAGSAVSVDLLGSLTSVLTGAAISFVELCGIVIRNKSTTSTEVLTIGGGSNPVVGLWGASGDAIKVGPGGVFVWFDPIDGVSPIAGTGDLLAIDPGSDTIAYDLLLLGRSA